MVQTDAMSEGECQNSKADLSLSADVALSERRQRMESRASERLAGLFPQHLEEVVGEVVACSVGEIVGTVEALIDRSFQSGKFSGAIEGVVTRFFRRDLQRVLAGSSESFHFQRWDEVESQVRDIREALEAAQKSWEDKHAKPVETGSPQAVAMLTKDLGAMRERMELMLQEFVGPQSAEVQGSIEGLEGRIEEVREELRWYASRQAEAVRQDLSPLCEDIESNSRALEVLTGRCVDIANRVDAAADSAAEAAAAAERAEKSAERAAASAAAAPSVGPPSKQESHDLASNPSSHKAREPHQTKAEGSVHNYSHRHHEATDRDQLSPTLRSQQHHHRDRREAGQLNSSATTSPLHASEHGSKDMKGPLAEYKREVVQLGGRLDEYMARMEAIREELQLHTVEQCQNFQAKIEEKMDAKLAKIEEAAVSAAAVDARRRRRKNSHSDSCSSLQGRGDNNSAASGSGMVVDSRGHRHHAAGDNKFIPKHLTQHSCESSCPSWGGQGQGSPSMADSTTSLDSTRRFMEQLEGAEARRNNRKHSDVSTGLSTAVTTQGQTSNPAAASPALDWAAMKKPSPREESFDGRRMKNDDSQDQWSVFAESAKSESLAGLPTLQSTKMPSMPSMPSMSSATSTAAPSKSTFQAFGTEPLTGSPPPDVPMTCLLQGNSAGVGFSKVAAESATPPGPPPGPPPGRTSRSGSLQDALASCRLPPVEKPQDDRRGFEVQAPAHARPQSRAETSRPGRQLHSPGSS